MKFKALSLSLGLALLAGTQAPAYAGGDWYHGGSIKDASYGDAAVAVPAPAPVPVYPAQYYFRADAGFGVGDNPSASESGLQFGGDRVGGGFGVVDSWIDSDFETLVTLGVGVGTYWGNSFRTDFTAETRSQAKVKINGDYLYNGQNTRVRGTIDDETTLRGGIFLFNAYYDLDSFARYSVRPYIGLGVGFAWNELKRNHATREFECSPRPCSPTLQRASFRDSDKTHSVSVAATAMAGVTYKLTENAALDLNYRFLFVDGMDVDIGVSGRYFGGTSKVRIDEMHQHQLRAGLRYDLN